MIQTEQTETDVEWITNAPDCYYCDSSDTTYSPPEEDDYELKCRECTKTFDYDDFPHWVDDRVYPPSMVERDQWMNWFHGDRGKVPCTHHLGEGRVCQWSDAGNWTNFDYSVKELEEEEKEDLEGITYVLSEDDPFVVFDGDDVRDPETGEIHLDFQDLIYKAESYTDISTSGEGAHVIVRGQLPEQYQGKGITIPVPDSQGFQNAKIEIFDKGRHIVMTGDHVSGTPITIEDGQEVINHLCDRWGDAQESEDPESDQSDTETVPIPGGYDGGDSPDDRPQCYHAALKAREEHEGRRAFQTNTHAGLLGLSSEYPIKVIIDHFERHEPPYNFDEGKTQYHLERLQDKRLFRPSVYTLAQGGILKEPECDCPLHETKGEDRGTTKDIPEGKKMKPAQALPLGSNPPTKKDTPEVHDAPDFSYPTLDRVTDAGRELGIASVDQILNHNRVDRGRTQVSKVLDALSDAGGVYHIRDGRYGYWCFGKGYVNEGRIEEIERQQDREINFEWSDLKWITEIEEEE